MAQVFLELFGKAVPLPIQLDDDADESEPTELGPLLAGLKREISFAALDSLFSKYLGAGWSSRRNKHGTQVYIVRDEDVGISFTAQIDRDWDHTDCAKCSKRHRLVGMFHFSFLPHRQILLLVRHLSNATPSVSREHVHTSLV